MLCCVIYIMSSLCCVLHADAPGNVDESSTNELVVAVEYTSTTDQSVHKVMLVSLTAQPDPNQPFLINGSHAINWVCGVCRVRACDRFGSPPPPRRRRRRWRGRTGRHCYAGPAYRESEDQQEVTVNNMALSVGNLYGLGYRVGEPKTVRFESVPELLAVVNAPPTHYDVLDGEEIAVNQRTLGGHGWNVIHQARRLHALDAAAQRQPRGERLASDPDGNAKKRKGKSTTITKRHRGACACF